MRWVGTAVCTLLLLTGCADGEDVAAPSPTGASTTSPTPTPTPTPPPTEPAGPTVDQVVTEFLDALGADSERAWELLSSRSQEGFGSFAAFAELESDYGEGLAAYSGADRASFDLADDLTVVTLSGDITREGATETDAAALPVRRGQDGPRIELTPPRLTGAVIEVPERGGPPLPRDAELRATVPAQAQATVLLDGEVREFRQEPSDGDRLLLTFAPGLAPGQHLLTVAAVRADGLLVAAAATFQVR